MDNNILCHVVGLNNYLKLQFESELRDIDGLIVKDIDQITDQIRNINRYVTLQRQINNARDMDRKRDNIKKLNRIWKEEFSQRLDNFLRRHKNSKVVLIGLSTYHRDHRIKVSIPTNRRFFLSLNDATSAKQLISYNLDQYRHNIIDGVFPLKYIDMNYLVTQRDKIRNIYMKLNYKLKTYDSLKTMIKKDVNHSIASPQRGGEQSKLKTVDPTIIRWFVASLNPYEGNIIIPFKQTGKGRRRKRGIAQALLKNSPLGKIVSYNQPWLSMLSSIPNLNHSIKKGFYQSKSTKKLTPFIEERYEDAFEELKRPCHMYEIDWQNEPLQSHKTLIDKQVKINRKIFIENIFTELDKLQIRKIGFKN